jgi:hypothetical protein
MKEKEVKKLVDKLDVKVEKLSELMSEVVDLKDELVTKVEEEDVDKDDDD